MKVVGNYACSLVEGFVSAEIVQGESMKGVVWVP